MSHTPGNLSVVVCTDGKYPEHHCQLAADVLSGRSGVVADTLNCDCIFSLEDQRANAERLAKCWNEHDVLVAACKSSNVADLISASEATLLFHDGSPWSAAKASRWEELTGQHDATTRTLCDFVRSILAKQVR